MSLDRAIEIERHNCEMSRLGLFPERLEQSERRLRELQAEREILYQQEDLRAAAALTRMTAPKKREPTCLRPMGADEYLSSKGEVREDKESPFHH